MLNACIRTILKQLRRARSSVRLQQFALINRTLCKRQVSYGGSFLEKKIKIIKFTPPSIAYLLHLKSKLFLCYLFVRSLSFLLSHANFKVYNNVVYIATTISAVVVVCVVKELCAALYLSRTGSHRLPCLCGAPWHVGVLT